jgi:hypothetical protein
MRINGFVDVQAGGLSKHNPLACFDDSQANDPLACIDDTKANDWPVLDDPRPTIDQ